MPQSSRFSELSRRGKRASAAPALIHIKPLELQRLDLQEVLDRERAVLAPVPGLLVAAERRRRVERAAVDLDLTGAHAAGDPLCALLVAGPHAAGEAVDRVVRDPDRVLFILVGDD